MSGYKVGIIGFGWVAGAHLSSYVELEQFEPVAVLSRRELDPQMFRDQYKAGDIKVYNDLDEFLADDEIEIVDICTPHFLHAEQAIAAANAGKNLVIEKPIALTWEDAVAMLDAVEKNDVRTSVCFEARFIGVARWMKSAIDQGLIGDVYYSECNYFHGIGPSVGQFVWNVKKDGGGSSLLTAGCHSLDMMLYLSGKQVEEAFSYTTRNPHPDYAPYEFDPTSVAILKFSDGTVGKVASVTDSMQPYGFHMHFFGSHGSLKDDQFHSKKVDGMEESWSKMGVELVGSGDVAHHPYSEQFTYYAECLDKGIDGHNNLASAVETHRVIFAADKSAATGKPVRLSEFSR